MRVFIAGASGVIGVEIIKLLVADGHEVAGMTRTPAKADRIGELGAQPVVCDVYDREALVAAVVDFRPDVVMHQLTDLPSDREALASAMAANDRMRSEGTANLIAAAQAAGARIVAQSIAFEVPEPTATVVADHEAALLAAGGVVLRYGHFYGEGTYTEEGTPPPPAIHVADAARETVALIGADPGIFTIVEEDVAA